MDMEKIILGALGSITAIGTGIVTAYIKNNFTNLKKDFQINFTTLNNSMSDIKNEHAQVKEIVLGFEKRLDTFENNAHLKMTRKNQLLKIYDQIFREVSDENLCKFAKIYSESYTNSMLRSYELVDNDKFNEVDFNEITQNNVNDLMCLKSTCNDLLGKDFSDYYFAQIHVAGAEFLSKIKNIVLRKRNNKTNELHSTCCTYLYASLGDLISMWSDFKKDGNTIRSD